MAESEERPPTKILVRAANGDLCLIRKGANPDIKHSHDPNVLPQDPDLVEHPQQHDSGTSRSFRSVRTPV